MAPIPQDCNRVGNLQDFLKAMAYVDNGVALLREPAHGLQKNIHLMIRKRRRRLVQDQSRDGLRVIILKGAGDRDHRPVRRSERRQFVIGTAADLELVEEPLSSGPQLLPPNLPKLVGNSFPMAMFSATVSGGKTAGFW